MCKQIRTKTLGLCLFAFLFFVISGCSSSSKTPPPQIPQKKSQLPLKSSANIATPRTSSLYEKLGGERALFAITQSMLIRLRQEEIMTPVFQRLGGVRFFKQRLYEFLCERAGGNCVFAGTEGWIQDLKLTRKEQQKILQTLSETLVFLRFSDADQQALLELLK